MPAVVQAITYAIPARYFLVVSRGIILKGAPLTAYARDMGFLVLYGTIVMGVAYARLTRREV
jgi:ABC-2 type transport system permease protein